MSRVMRIDSHQHFWRIADRQGQMECIFHLV